MTIQSNIRAGMPTLKEQKKMDEMQRKRNEMLNSKEYKAMLKKNIKWLQSLDASDSNAKNGRVDVSVFNAKVAKFGYEASLERRENSNLGFKKDVDIKTQAESMTEKYYAKKFGLH